MGVVDELDWAIQLALAEGSRGVVCDLSAVHEGAEPAAVDMLATAGRHVRDRPGTPVAVACPDSRVRSALAADPLGGHLIVSASMRSTVSTVLATPTPAVEWLHLAPHPTAPRASREFVTRTREGSQSLLSSPAPSGFCPPPTVAESSGRCSMLPGHAHRPAHPVPRPRPPLRSRRCSPTPPTVPDCSWWLGAPLTVAIETADGSTEQGADERAVGHCLEARK